MAQILKKLYQGYFWIITEIIDPRAEGYFLLSSPLQPLMIALGYLYLVSSFLPKFMENRRPYNLNKILVIFNLTQVIINAFISYHCFLELLRLDWSCAPIDFSATPHDMFIVRLAYFYFLTKVADLFDTIFFYLRKKITQVSFLHVYHHFGMIVLSWVGARFLAGGHSIFVVARNSFVHTVMYFYYLITIWKPEYKKSVWWKKHVTQLQLAQFVFVFFIYGQLLFKPKCDYPKFACCVVVYQSVFMLVLFADFYWKEYIRPTRTQKLY